MIKKEEAALTKAAQVLGRKGGLSRSDAKLAGLSQARLKVWRSADTYLLDSDTVYPEGYYLVLVNKKAHSRVKPIYYFGNRYDFKKISSARKYVILKKPAVVGALQEQVSHGKVRLIGWVADGLFTTTRCRTQKKDVQLLY